MGLDACNDTNYLPPRHRTLPTQASVTPIANYPSKLRIFLTNASRYWQVRCYLKRKTYTQSLRTTNKQAAISLAKQFFHIKTAELFADKIEVRPDKKVKFADLVPAVGVALQARVKRGEFAAANIPIFLNRMHNSILPYFGDMSMEQINYRHLSDFMEQMSNRNLTATTVHQHMVAIKKIFAYAHGNSIIQHQVNQVGYSLAKASTAPKDGGFAPDIAQKNSEPRGDDRHSKNGYTAQSPVTRVVPKTPTRVGSYTK